jgi:hypothetical protein
LIGCPAATQVADHCAYFKATDRVQSGNKLLRIPVESDGAFETVLPDASWNDVTADGARAYYTEHGAVRTAR